MILKWALALCAITLISSGVAEWFLRDNLMMSIGYNSLGLLCMGVAELLHRTERLYG